MQRQAILVIPSAIANGWASFGASPLFSLAQAPDQPEERQAAGVARIANLRRRGETNASSNRQRVAAATGSLLAARAIKPLVETG